MRLAHACTRSVIFAVLALTVTGCRGCVPEFKKHDWDAAMRSLAAQGYLQGYLRVCGPLVVASAVGIAAPPGAYSPLSALGADMAWRELLESEFNRSDYLAAAASVVGASAPPGGWGGFSAVGTVAARNDWRQQPGDRLRLPSLFEPSDPNQLWPADQPVEPQAAVARDRPRD
jgi:hypothetical protein